MRALAVVLVMTACAAVAHAGPPSWLVDAAAIRTDADTTAAVILLLDERVTVEPGGRTVTIRRGAIRVLRKAGAEHAVAGVGYDTAGDRVRRLAAWVLPRNGSAVELGAREAMDAAVVDFEVYSQQRRRTLSATDWIEAGDVFGWESVLEEKSIFSQTQSSRGSELPCRLWRFVLELPAGWRADARLYHDPPVEPQVKDGTWTWELRDLPGLQDETACPPVTSLAPRLVVGWAPAAERAAPGWVPASSWAEVARWLFELTDPMSAPSPETQRQAAELVRGAKTELDTLRAVARFVQGMRYAAISLGLNRGGGMRPNPAPTVLARSYGDCKDKANLMRSLLASLGIDSRLAVVYSGDPEYVRADWPSPLGFNHCILAIRTRSPLPTTIEAPGGRATFFDPTDPLTELGDLPEGVQGALTLLVTTESREPIRLPRLGAEVSRLGRRLELALKEDGGMTASMVERASGQMGHGLRRMVRLSSSREWRRASEAWLAGSVSGARLDSLDLREEDRARLVRFELEFTAPRYAQVMRGRLMVVQPFLSPSSPVRFTGEAARRHPIELESWALFDTAIVRLPSGFSPDEIPEAVELETSFGHFTTTVTTGDAEIRITRALVVEPRRLPVGDYPAVRDFFRRVAAVEASPVVLERR